MSIFNGLRKAFTSTPSVPTIPHGILTPQQEIEFLNSYKRFSVEVEKYKSPVDRTNVPMHFKEIRIEQYEKFKSEVARFVKGISDKKFRTQILKIDSDIVTHLLDHQECLHEIVKNDPLVIRNFPTRLQEAPEIAELILEHNVGKVKHLSLKFRNDPSFMYRCLADDSKFDGIGLFPSKVSRREVIQAIGSDLGAKLDLSDSGSVATQLKQIMEAEANAIAMSQQCANRTKSTKGIRLSF